MPLKVSHDLISVGCLFSMTLLPGSGGGSGNSGGGGSAINDGINCLQSRLTKLTAAGRRLSHEANAAAGPSGGSGQPPPTPVSQALVAQLEAQERHMAAWFADLQWQLEGIFSSQQSRMQSGSGGGGGTLTPNSTRRDGWTPAQRSMAVEFPGGKRTSAGPTPASRGGGTWRG
jgi:hypothetical protein